MPEPVDLTLLKGSSPLHRAVDMLERLVPGHRARTRVSGWARPSTRIAVRSRAAAGRGLLPRGAPRPAALPKAEPPAGPRPAAARLRRRDLPRVRVVRQRRRVARRPPRGRPVAVGTILAAAGTALPESVVTLVAVLFGSPEHGDDIGVGAALGGPLVVGTIAYGVTGVMLIWRSAGCGRAAAHGRRPGGASAPPDGRRRRRAGGDRAGPRLRTPTTSTAPTPPGWPATRSGSW